MFLKNSEFSARVQNSTLEAYKEYCAHHDKQVDDTITYAEMLEDMKQILKI